MVVGALSNKMAGEMAGARVILCGWPLDSHLLLRKPGLKQIITAKQTRTLLVEQDRVNYHVPGAWNGGGSSHDAVEGP
jgi:hypothetical protein